MIAAPEPIRAHETERPDPEHRQRVDWGIETPAPQIPSPWRQTADWLDLRFEEHRYWDAWELIDRARRDGVDSGLVRTLLDRFFDLEWMTDEDGWGHYVYWSWLFHRDDDGDEGDQDHDVRIPPE